MRDGIWIRTQDREAFSFVKDFRVADYGSRNNRQYVVVADGILELGKYITFNRAKEVIDGIQNAVLQKREIYEMPKE